MNAFTSNAVNWLNRHQQYFYGGEYYGDPIILVDRDRIPGYILAEVDYYNSYVCGFSSGNYPSYDDYSNLDDDYANKGRFSYDDLYDLLGC